MYGVFYFDSSIVPLCFLLHTSYMYVIFPSFYVYSVIFPSQFIHIISIFSPILIASSYLLYIVFYFIGASIIFLLPIFYSAYSPYLCCGNRYLVLSVLSCACTIMAGPEGDECFIWCADTWTFGWAPNTNMRTEQKHCTGVGHFNRTIDSGPGNLFLVRNLGHSGPFSFWVMFFFLARAPNPSQTQDGKLGFKFRFPNSSLIFLHATFMFPSQFLCIRPWFLCMCFIFLHTIPYSLYIHSFPCACPLSTFKGM